MLANFMMDRYGLYLSLAFAALLNALGAWLRIAIAADDQFVWAILGQLVAGIPNAFVLSAPSRISVLWFPKHQQNLATVLASMTYPVGSSFSFILPTFFLSDSDKLDPAAGKTHMRQYILVQSGIVTVTSVLMLVFFRSKPPSPPTTSAVIERTDFFAGAKLLVCNGNYWVLTVAFMFYWSLYVSIGAVISQVTDLYKYPTDASAVIGSVYHIVGFVGSNFYTGFLFSKVKKFKTPIVAMMGVSLGLLIATYFTFAMGKTWLVTVMFSLAMAHLMSCFPMFLELGSEIGYPVSESTINGFIQIPVQFFSAGLVFLVQYFVNNFNDKPFIAYLILLIDFALGIVVMLFVK